MRVPLKVIPGPRAQIVKRELSSHVPFGSRTDPPVCSAARMAAWMADVSS